MQNSKSHSFFLDPKIPKMANKMWGRFFVVVKYIMTMSEHDVIKFPLKMYVITIDAQTFWHYSNYEIHEPNLYLYMQ